MSRTPVLLLGLLACGGLQADDFVQAYTDSYCNLRLQCGDTAGLVFDGADTLESCEAQYGPRFEAEGEGCLLKSKLGNQCLDDLDALSCPDDGDIDGALPSVCGTVWVKCDGGGGDGGTTPTTSSATEGTTGASR